MTKKLGEINLTEKNFDEKYTGKNIIEKKPSEKNLAKKLDEKNLDKIPNEFLSEILKLFKSTQDKFITGMLCKKFPTYDSDEEVPHFCGVGECLHAVGFSCDSLHRRTGVLDLLTQEMVKDAIQRLQDKFGIDFTARYEYPIICPTCNKLHADSNKLSTFHSVVIHGNDAHSESFDDLAEYLIMMSKEFNLRTGRPIQDKLNIHGVNKV